MKRLLSAIFLSIFLAVPASVNAKPAPDAPLTITTLQSVSDSFVKVAGHITPAVVGIATRRVVADGEAFFSDPYFRWFFGDREQHHNNQREEEGQGSGVLVSARGLIVTNAHVVDGADHIAVTLSDRRSFKAAVVGVDEKTDLALLKVDAPDLPWVPLGSSTDLQPGQIVLAVGNPFGLNQTVTMGIISGVGRQGVGITDYEDFIQTDAAINPGNSGGAMVNTRGELIGINTAIFTQSGGYEGIGFAIPANLVKSVVRSLEKSGRVVRGWLGVSIQEVSPELAEQFQLPQVAGALVTDIIPRSPAAHSGLQRGDVILSLDGNAIGQLSQLRLQVAATEVGAEVAVKVWRGGRGIVFPVVLGELPEDLTQLKQQRTDADPDGTVLSGLTVGALDADIMGRFGLDLGTHGVVVLAVKPGSAASRSDILRGDLILEINREPVATMDDFRSHLGSIQPGDQIMLTVSRHGQSRYVVISP